MTIFYSIAHSCIFVLTTSPIHTVFATYVSSVTNYMQIPFRSPANKGATLINDMTAKNIHFWQRQTGVLYFIFLLSLPFDEYRVLTVTSCWCLPVPRRRRRMRLATEATVRTPPGWGLWTSSMGLKMIQFLIFLITLLVRCKFMIFSWIAFIYNFLCTQYAMSKSKFESWYPLSFLESDLGFGVKMHVDYGIILLYYVNL